MKAGIITFHDANNYGAVLQAYALNSKMNEYCETEIINYNNLYFHKNENIKGLKSKIIELCYKKDMQKKDKEFVDFRKNNLYIRDKIVKKEDLQNLNNKYDLFISGSDQVWNLKCSGYDDTYFLNFVNDRTKKFSYSASFGTSMPELDEEHINFIKEFNKVSVREKSGKEYLNKINIDSIKTCDPVFLLKKEQWDIITESSNDKYILVYEVVNGVNMISFAKQLSKITGLKVVVITSSKKPILGVKTVRNIGPINWLKLIKNADYIITNSFHGLAFSLIFNKQFFIELLSNSNSNARMLELLEEMNLKSRLLKNVKCEKIELIQFDIINKIIDTDRNNSIKYIESIIQGD